MAINKLQNNFTTPEQSKRLLELGVPEWTADCLIKNNAEKDKPTIRVKEPCTGYYFAHDEYIPCWSVGRLMEILDICNVQSEVGDFWPTHKTNMKLHSLTQLEYLITWAINCKELLDFSKLEE